MSYCKTCYRLYVQSNGSQEKCNQASLSECIRIKRVVELLHLVHCRSGTKE